MKNLLGRFVVWAFEVYAKPTVSGPLVRLYDWGCERVYPPYTEEDRRKDERFRQAMRLADAVEVLESGPDEQWSIRVGDVDTPTFRLVYAHSIAADLRHALADLYPEHADLLDDSVEKAA